MTNRHIFRSAPKPSNGPIPSDLPRPVPVVPVAKPRGKIHPGGENKASAKILLKINHNVTHYNQTVK